MATSYAPGRLFDLTVRQPMGHDDENEQARVVAVLADIATMVEHSGRRPASIACCFVGDGRGPMVRTLLVTAALMGMDIRVAAPRELWPPDETITLAEDMAARTGAAVLVTSDAGHAVLGADFVCTDRWVSAEPELWLYRVTEELLATSGRPGTAFLHLAAALPGAAGGAPPAPRDLVPDSGEEVCDAVLDSADSLVRAQAVNRSRAADLVSPHGTRPMRGTSA